MSQRTEFCRLAIAANSNVSELCRRHGVSRTTAYKWLERYEAEGSAGLVDRSRRPLSSPERTSEDVEAQVEAVRREHPAWGGRKIRRVLQMQGLTNPPSASTITEILRRRALLDGPGAGEVRPVRRFEYDEPNELWQMDFKGHFATVRGRCHPLTILDDHSRYSLEIGACGDEQGDTVRARLTQVFRRQGMPWRMLTDNGPPWGAPSREGYSRLGLWLMDLDIGLIHGRPYHPQTQGKDERFHRTLNTEVLSGRIFTDLGQAQAAFDQWREVYNTRRPHEALGLATPASRYRMSPRAMPETISPAEYEPGVQTRMVQDGGWISFRNQPIRCSSAFKGRRLALRATDTDGLFDICYRSHTLAQIDLRRPHQPVSHVPEQVSTLSPV